MMEWWAELQPAALEDMFYKDLATYPRFCDELEEANEKQEYAEAYIPLSSP